MLAFPSALILPTESFPRLAMQFLPTDFLLAPHQASSVHGHPTAVLPYQLPTADRQTSPLDSPESSPTLPFRESPISPRPASGSDCDSREMSEMPGVPKESQGDPMVYTWVIPQRGLLICFYF